MKSRIKKNIVSFFAVASIIINQSITSFASNAAIDNYSDTFCSNTEIMDINQYINEILPTYLFEKGIKEENEIKISHPCKIENKKDSWYVFVTRNNSLIGKMKIYKHKDCFYSFYSSYISDYLKYLYHRGESIGLYFDEKINEILLVSDNNFYLLDENNDHNDIIEHELNNESCKRISLSDFELFKYEEPVKFENLDSLNTDLIMATQSVLLGSKILNPSPTYIANSNYYNITLGQYEYVCWAACVAMVVNLFNSTNYSANYVASHAPETGLSSYRITNAYFNCGYQGVSYVNSALNPSTVFNTLDAGKPLQIIIRDSTTHPQNEDHAILIKEIYLYNDKSTYTIIDPSMPSCNCEFSITITGNPITTNSTMSYQQTYGTLGSYDYTTWLSTYY